MLLNLIRSTGKQMAVDLIEGNNKNKMLCHYRIEDKASIYMYICTCAAYILKTLVELNVFSI